jgi:hypothetical protein
VSRTYDRDVAASIAARRAVGADGRASARLVAAAGEEECKRGRKGRRWA